MPRIGGPPPAPPPPPPFQVDSPGISHSYPSSGGARNVPAGPLFLTPSKVIAALDAELLPSLPDVRRRILERLGVTA